MIFLAETCGFLLKLADFYQVEDVVQKCDKFLANDSTVPIIEKLPLVDKFKLLETKNACLNLEELKRPDFVRDFAKKPEYSELSDGFKVILFENALNSVVHEVVLRKVCKMADFSVPTPLTDVVLIVEGKRLHVSRNVNHFIFLCSLNLAYLVSCASFRSISQDAFGRIH